MSDLRTRLDRLGQRMEPRPDAFERLEAVRRRRARNRRIEAGAVAFAVAIAGSLAAFVAFRDSEPAPAGDVEGGFFALWPEKTLDDALAAQEAVDAGEADLRWRIDPQEVALRFATEALGWQNAAMTSATRLDSGGLEVGVVDVWGSFDVRHQAAVTIDRLVGGGSSYAWSSTGIWSVIEVGGDASALPVEPGDEVALGSVISIPTTLEETAGVAVGVKGTGPCSGFSEHFTRVVDGTIEVPIEGVGDGCSGYVYVLTPPTPEGQVELGRIMFSWNEDKPALDYTIETIAAVPVRFVAATAEPAPADVMRISCDGSTVEVHTRVVETQRDGVHVEVVNSGERALEIRIGDLDTIGVTSMALGPRDLQSSVLSFGPGVWPVVCSSPQQTDSAGSAMVGSTEVVDPAGWYTPWFLDCPADQQYSQDGPMERISGDPRDPLEVARGHATGLEANDALEPAGYAEAANPSVRIVREGTIVGSLLFGWDDDSQGWMLVQIAGCDGTSFGWAVDPTPAANPNGWFEWCPAGPFPEAPRDWIEPASEVAFRFARAYVDGDAATLAEVIDPSVPEGATFTVALADGVDPVVGATDAHGGPVVNYSCGDDVDAYTFALTIDDGTESASADFTVFLVFREDGWKVWGVY